jgi:hypothetical protein
MNANIRPAVYQLLIENKNAGPVKFNHWIKGLGFLNVCVNFGWWKGRTS